MSRIVLWFALIAAGLGVWWFMGQRAHNPAPVRFTAPTVRGSVDTNVNDGQAYAFIPPGSFRMGCYPENPACQSNENSHAVTISKGFWLGQTEVTVGAYRQFALATLTGMPSESRFNPGWRDAQQPIVNVIWDDAAKFCKWAGGRLPSEAEWEYAARAGSASTAYGPVDDIAWHSGNALLQHHPVKQRAPNFYGLYDTLGNAAEWTNDWYGAYPQGPATDPKGPASGEARVIRGGSVFDVPQALRVTRRYGALPNSAAAVAGFRCAIDP